MAEKFNLLPKKQAGTSETTKLGKMAKRAAIGSFVISVIIFAGGIATLFILQNNQNKVKQDTSSTRGQISALESAESGLVISKDRAQKIQRLFELRKNEEIYKKYMDLNDQLPASIEISRVELTDNVAEVTFIGTNSKDFSDFMNQFVLNQASFNVIYFNNVGVDEKTGYKLVLEIR